MGVPRYAARADSNGPELVEFARLKGAIVVYIREPVDILVGFAGVWTPAEIKTEEARGKKNEFKKQQLDFFAEIAPHGLPHWVWYTREDVKNSLGSIA